LKKKKIFYNLANIILISSAFLAFIFPDLAKWIVLILVVTGLISWVFKSD